MKKRITILVLLLWAAIVSSQNNSVTLTWTGSAPGYNVYCSLYDTNLTFNYKKLHYKHYTTNNSLTLPNNFFGDLVLPVFFVVTGVNTNFGTQFAYPSTNLSCESLPSPTFIYSPK